jgi:hypothetical protein
MIYFTYLIALRVRHVHGRGGSLIRHTEVLVIFIKNAPGDFDGLVLPFLRPIVCLKVPQPQARMEN